MPAQGRTRNRDPKLNTETDPENPETHNFQTHAPRDSANASAGCTIGCARQRDEPGNEHMFILQNF